MQARVDGRGQRPALGIEVGAMRMGFKERERHRMGNREIGQRCPQPVECRGRLESRVVRSEHRVGERSLPVPVQGVDEPFLAGKVAIDRADRDAGPLRDLGNRRSAVAARFEELECGVEYGVGFHRE